MLVRIPSSQLYMCQMYLSQNYIMPHHDYCLIAGAGYSTIEFYRLIHYSMFVARFGTGIICVDN